VTRAASKPAASGRRFSAPKRRPLPRRIAIWLLVAAGAFFAFFGSLILALKWLNPLTTAVQMQRRVEALLAHKPYKKRCAFVPIERISPNLRHAVIAAEDTRFLEHSGIDWIEMQKVLEKDLEKRKLGRGGSTITQQLIKNLFFTTNRSLVRKGMEFLLVPVVEFVLGKERILELYLNVIEWGPGVYGAEASARYWYKTSAWVLSREQAARLASVVPNPKRRKPERMDNYTEIILTRMRQMGW
jgi:monofunctional biosynthetic peptidoglycan transglycosylase